MLDIVISENASLIDSLLKLEVGWEKKFVWIGGVKLCWNWNGEEKFCWGCAWGETFWRRLFDGEVGGSSWICGVWELKSTQSWLLKSAKLACLGIILGWLLEGFVATEEGLKLASSSPKAWNKEWLFCGGLVCSWACCCGCDCWGWEVPPTLCF